MKVLSTREVMLATFVVLLLALLVAAELWTARRVNLVGVTHDNAGAQSSSMRLHQQVQESTLWKIPRPKDSKEIRKWGCNKTETPFIFVHIGKAGGGSVRSRIAASSLNYSYTKSGGLEKLDGSYYPVSGETKAHFASSCFTRHLPSDEDTYEGTNPCHASTPLGQAIGCPETLQKIRRQEHKRHGECDPFSDTCHLVYVGHNFFGSEMHWLPVQYLKKWWASLGNDNAITPLWDKLLPDGTWCASKKESRPVKAHNYAHDYEQCSIPLQREVDTKVIHALTNHLSIDESQVITSWSPLYASLPVLRVTVMRDPFSWLVSKYFWHRTKEDGLTCDDVEEATLWTNPRITRPHRLKMNKSGPGWVSRMCLGYIMYICGEDCIVRYAAGTATLEDLELQAEGNLRQAFAVVGILEEVDTFYEMLTARVHYIDTSLNSNVSGSKHSTGSFEGIQYCRDRFQDPNFQTQLLELSPELRALHRLYQVAKEVNRFQLQELRECSS